MELKVDRSTRDALLQNRTLRCLYKAKYRQESRDFRDAVAWAEGRMAKFCTELLRQITQPPEADDAEAGQRTGEEPDKTPDKNADKNPDERPDKKPVTDTKVLEAGSTAPRYDYDTKLNHITLLPGTKAYFLFDVFLGDCDSATRTHVLWSFEEPVHIILRRNHVYYVNRDGRVNKMVRAAYTQSRDNDKSARPLFRDSHNHPIYMNGYRIEAEEWVRVRPREVGEEEEEDEVEEEYDDDQDNVTHEEMLREDNGVMEGMKRLTREYGAATPPRDVVAAITDVNNTMRYNVGYYVG